MRGLRLTLVVGAALASGAMAQTVSNGSFETNGGLILFDGWDAFGEVYADGPFFWCDSDDIDPNDGDVAAKMFGNFNGTVQSDNVLEQFVSGITVGKQYDLSVWAYNSSADELQVGNRVLAQLLFKDAGGGLTSYNEVVVFDDTTPLATDTWTEFTISAVAPANSTQAQIDLLHLQTDGMAAGATFWDSVSLTESDPPAPCVPDLNNDGLLNLADVTTFIDAFIAGCAGGDPTMQEVYDSDSGWLGYMNVFELDGTSFVFGSPWGITDLVANFDDGAQTLTLLPNSIDDPDPFWYIGGGAPGNPGNKVMEANLYREVTDGSLAGETVTFSGNIDSNTFTSAHETRVFIRDFVFNFSSFTETSAVVTDGNFSISHVLANNPTNNIQFGFQVKGENVWITDIGPFGSMVVDTVGPAPAVGPCIADLNDDGLLNLADVTTFIDAFIAGCP